MDCVAAFISGLIVGYVFFHRNLSDYKFRLKKDGKEIFYIANKTVEEKWMDGLAEFSYVDLKEENQYD